MRLIDADALYAMVDGLVKNKSGVYEKGKDRAFNIVKCALHNKCATPTIDAEPVIRCKDCVHYSPYKGEEHKGDCLELVGLESCIYEDDFCSYAEPKARDEE